MPAVDVPLRVDSFAVNAVALMRSTLTHTGAVHEEVAEVPLGGKVESRKSKTDIRKPMNNG